jgi:hypothetical protein
LPEHSIVFYRSLYRDGAGHSFPPVESAARIGNAANAAFYSVAEVFTCRVICCMIEIVFYGAAFRERVGEMGIREVLTAPRCPWQNPFAERFISSLRRGRLDHIIVFNESSLRRILKAYFEYYERVLYSVFVTSLAAMLIFTLQKRITRFRRRSAVPRHGRGLVFKSPRAYQSSQSVTHYNQVFSCSKTLPIYIL